MGIFLPTLILSQGVSGVTVSLVQGTFSLSLNMPKVVTFITLGLPVHVGCRVHRMNLINPLDGKPMFHAIPGWMSHSKFPAMFMNIDIDPELLL